MKLFKNNVGRPSNETLKKRKIMYLSLAIAVVVSLAGIMDLGYSYFSSKGIIGNSKNVASRMRVVKKSNVELRITRTLGGVYINDKPSLNFSVEVYPKSKKVYRQYRVYKNGKQASKSACEVVNAPGIGVLRDFVVEENNSYYVKAFVYSDSKCTKQLAYLKTNTYKVGTIKPKVYINANSTSESKLVYQVKPQLSKNTYAKTIVYKDGKQSKVTTCTKIKYNTAITVSSSLSGQRQQYYKVQLYSDSKCKKQISSVTSKTFDTIIKPNLLVKDKKITELTNRVDNENVFVSKSIKTIPTWDTQGVTKTFYYSAVRKDYNVKTKKTKSTRVITCKKVSTLANTQLVLSVDKTNIRSVIEAELYTDSKCVKGVAGTDSVSLVFDTVAPTYEDVCIDNSNKRVQILGVKDKTNYDNNGAIEAWRINEVTIDCNSTKGGMKWYNFGYHSFMESLTVEPPVFPMTSAKLCIWDYAGNLTQKNITLKKCK